MDVTKREKNEKSISDYYLKEGDKKLGIFFGGNLDLYWSLTCLKEDYCLNDNCEKKLQEKFIITKENYFIYSLFDELITDIKEAKVYEPITSYQEDMENIDQLDIFSFIDIEEREDRNQSLNEQLKSNYRYRLLYDGESITWHSDEEEYSIADRVKISKIDDNIILEFIRPELTNEGKFNLRMPGTITIRFRNSGSTYDPFNIIFMRMYNKLQEYNPDYHQIHLEEVAYQRKLKLTK